MDAHALSTAFALRGATASLRTPPDRAVPTARPPTGVGGLLPDLSAELTRAVALDGPKVEANRRIYLPRCLDALSWTQADRLRLEVRDRVAVLAGDPNGRGKPVTVNARDRLVLPATCLVPLAVEPGQCLVAFVPDGRDHLVLFGAAAAQSLADLLVLPPHLRGLLARLGHGFSAVGAAAVARLVGKLDDAGLASLAGVSVERLVELGLVPPREVA